MTLSTGYKIALALKILFGAGFGFLMIGHSVAGASLGGLFAYIIYTSVPHPFASFPRSLSVNWRGFYLLGGIAGLLLLHYAFHLSGVEAAEVEVVLKSFGAGFIGMLLGELIGAVIHGFAFMRDPTT